MKFADFWKRVASSASSLLARWPMPQLARYRRLILATTVIVVGVVVVIVMTVVTARSIFDRVAGPRKHEQTEYYLTFNGYRHPLRLSRKLTRQAAEASEAYYIATYDSGGKLQRVVKMFRGSIFFDVAYTYGPQGKLKTIKGTNADGATIVHEYDDRGRERKPK
jgi:hypothetical protein